MLKKLIYMLLAVLICIFIVACSEMSTNSDSMQYSTEQAVEHSVQMENPTDKQTTAIVVHIAINPELKIHVGSDGNVFDVECLNDDAKVINGKVSIIGKSCKYAIVLILNEAVQQSFLENDGEIKITVSVTEEIEKQLDTWNNEVISGVTQALEDNKLNAKISFNSQVMKVTKEENDVQNNHIPSENKDGDIPVDNSLKENAADGNTVIKDEDGTITVIDKLVLDQYGNIICPQYAGQTIVTTDENGDVWNITYDENGYEVAAFTEYTDGLGFQWRGIKEYLADGRSIVNTCHYINGEWEPRTLYHDNGILAKDVGVSGHGLTVTYYDKNGHPMEIYSVDNFDNPTHIIYNADGSFTVTTNKKDGTIEILHYDKNGNEKH